MEQIAKRKKELISGGDPEMRYQIPRGDDFAGEEFIKADDLKAIGEALREECPEFEQLADVKIVYLWKYKGGGGARRILGKCTRPTGLLEYFADADFVIWLAADNCQFLTKWQIEAVVYHELLHAGVQDGEPVIVPHAYEGFPQEITRYGFWKRDIQRLADATADVFKLPFDEPVQAEQQQPEQTPLPTSAEAQA
jgi:hypothetical protein